MEYKITSKKRRELKEKIAEALKGNLKCLSTEFQKILIDDLVTAFQNRMNVLMRAQEKSSH